MFNNRLNSEIKSNLDKIIKVTLCETPVYNSERSKTYIYMTGDFYISNNFIQKHGRYMITNNVENVGDITKIIGWVRFNDIKSLMKVYNKDSYGDHASTIFFDETVFEEGDYKMKNNKHISELVDSGERKSFESGAVREIIVGKGRFDLIPFDAMNNIINDKIYKYIGSYMETKNTEYLEKAVHDAIKMEIHYKNRAIDNEYDFLMKLAHHFEQGALKYDDDNWRKGLPINSFIDSACRHYCKHKLGHTDEPHFIAFTWNIICAIWTSKHVDNAK